MDDAIVGVGSHIPFGNGGGQLTSHFTRVERSVSEHLSVQGKPDLREGFVVFGVQTKLEHFLLMHLTH